MISKLDLQDIQGNIVKAYGRYGFPLARYVFYRVDDPTKGRRFIQKVTPLVTTSVPWSENSPLRIPPVAVNIAFTYQGLRSLDVPAETLHGFPDEFSMGMKARRDILGDTGPNHYKHWDPIWNDPDDEFRQGIHILIGINGKDEMDLEDTYQQICGILDSTGGVSQLAGHRGPDGADNLPYQPAVADESGKEHFGYADGLSSPYFRGCGENPRYMIGGGKPTGGDPCTADGWAPLEPGEFLFGHEDESGAYPEAPGPPLFSRNGAYMVYRKLHENVGAFNSFIEEEGTKFPGGKEWFAAKMSGRWRNGAPLVTFPTEEGANRFAADLEALQNKVRQGTATASEKERLAKLKLQLVAYDYNDDPEGAKCPFGAHMRRVNPRSGLQFGVASPFDTPGALSNRRRILRRGLPYGKVLDATRDDGDHGVVMMIINADLSRQFEFVQQQWINYSNDLRLANDQDPLLGNHGINKDGRGDGRMMIEGDAKTGAPPYFCGGIPTLVETRGGDYFFIPSMTCLRMIAMGIVDPT
jgi:deferrochelatase/peroxidase EfeB